VRLAADCQRIHDGGAELAAVSVDDEGRQAGMAERWKLTHARMVADPGGERFLEPLGLFDPEERGGIALPGMVIVAPDGTEAYRFRGRDFADRTNDDALWQALDDLDLPPVSPDPWHSGVPVPPDLDRFFRPADLGPYFRGNMFGAVAIGRRSADEAGRTLAKEHRVMAQTTLEAWERLTAS
jgi:hypothetical protein